MADDGTESQVSGDMTPFIIDNMIESIAILSITLASATDHIAFASHRRSCLAPALCYRGSRYWFHKAELGPQGSSVKLTWPARWLGANLLLQEYRIEGNMWTERKDDGAVRLTCPRSWPVADMAAWRMWDSANDKITIGLGRNITRGIWITAHCIGPPPQCLIYHVYDLKYSFF